VSIGEHETKRIRGEIGPEFAKEEDEEECLGNLGTSLAVRVFDGSGLACTRFR
jgi:actin-like ATPase involved in cell morphogenesis